MVVAQGIGVAQAVLAPAGVVVAAKAAPAAPAVLALAVAEVAVAVGATSQEAVEVVELVQVAAVEDLVDVARRSLLLQTLVLGVADRHRRKTGAAELVHARVL